MGKESKTTAYNGRFVAIAAIIFNYIACLTARRFGALSTNISSLREFFLLHNIIYLHDEQDFYSEAIYFFVFMFHFL